MEKLVKLSLEDNQPKKREENTMVELYSSIWSDWMFKMTMASMLFLITFPWAAFYWPPYYHDVGRSKTK